ncbi:hypothetical protein ANN_22491, partial [Periplaneta americana]
MVTTEKSKDVLKLTKIIQVPDEAQLFYKEIEDDQYHLLSRIPLTLNNLVVDTESLNSQIKNRELKDPSVLKVRAGEWDTQTKNELYPHQDRGVKTFEIHPEYYAGALYNDVGLIFLDEPVDYAENVDVVCLPPQDAVFDHSQCFATGWGKDSY